MKLHSTVQPMGFDSSGGANFCAYPFLETDPFGASGDTALTPAARNYFSFYPPNENCPFGSSGDTALTPAARTYFFLYPP